MKKSFILFVAFLLTGIQLHSQVSINSDNSPPDPSAGLDVKFTNRGIVPPRMTNAQMNAIPNPAIGLMIYCADCGSTGTGAMMMFLGWKWVTMIVTCINPASPAAGTNVASPTQIIWNWNTVPGATGYKWSANDAYGTALDMGASTSKTETGLTPGTLYTRYVWAYNNCGNSTATTLTQLLPFLIGQSYGGGIIFYIDGTGQHGLISSTSDQGSGAQWGCLGTLIGGTGTGIGTGQANTTAIVNNCGTGTAAQICDALVLNGYTDWFLPSKDELNQMYIQRNVIGGFANYVYWSSSEYLAGLAWSEIFFGGSQDFDSQEAPFYVRAIRVF